MTLAELVLQWGDLVDACKRVEDLDATTQMTFLKKADVWLSAFQRDLEDLEAAGDGAACILLGEKADAMRQSFKRLFNADQKEC